MKFWNRIFSETSTVGIDVDKWKIEENKIINIWDFAGKFFEFFLSLLI
jgi:hypothetical protein